MRKIIEIIILFWNKVILEKYTIIIFIILLIVFINIYIYV